MAEKIIDETIKLRKNVSVSFVVNLWQINSRGKLQNSGILKG